MLDISAPTVGANGGYEAGTRPVAVTTAIRCEEFESILAEVLDRYELPPAALLHLADCRTCAETVSDFETIAESVRQLPPLESEPASDLWPHIRETLLREGVIHADGFECSSSTKPLAPQLVQRSPLTRS